MNSNELFEFFRTLGKGKKKIGSVHDNFGIGAKIATLPWNELGVVVLSYQGGKGAMIWIYEDLDTGDYQLKEFDIDGKKKAVIDPNSVIWSEGDVDWSQVAPDWIRDHGTIVVLLGSDDIPDTVFGNPKEGEMTTKGLSTYLNSRFWDLSDKEVRVVELRSTDKENWPDGPEDRKNLNNRRIQGARHFVTSVRSTTGDGHLLESGTMEIDESRVRVDWYLWEGDRPKVHGYAQEKGYVAVRYEGELYHLDSGRVRFRRFGIIEKEVQNRTTIILEPAHLPEDGGERWGVYPDQSRNRLMFTGDGGKGGDLPLTNWGHMFGDEMPESIYKAIRAARGKDTGTIDDEEYRRRLKNKFGDRWTMRKPVTEPDDGDVPATPTKTERSKVVRPTKKRTRRRRRRGRSGTTKVRRKEARLGGDERGTETDVPADIPRYAFKPKEDFEKEWHLAAFVPDDFEGPTVFLNKDAEVLLEIVEYHQQLYPEVHAEEVQKTVLTVFGEVAACKVAHSQRLASEVIEEDLNDRYRSEEALTLALMGLIAEESLITPRLSHLGPKKKVA
jgi:hypothetical protein